MTTMTTIATITTITTITIITTIRAITISTTIYTCPALAAVCSTVSPPEDTTKGAPFSNKRIKPT